jgi:hypothetical protein
MSDYHAEFEESLHEAVMLLHINHPTKHGMALEGDLPPCRMIDGLVGQLRDGLGPLILAFINMGYPVDKASLLALESVIRSGLEVGFATGRVFQSHGFNVPAKV